MMNTIKSAASKMKNHVVANKGAYIMGAVAVTAIALLECHRKGFESFLIEKGIDPLEYFVPEEFAELNN